MAFMLFAAILLPVVLTGVEGIPIGGEPYEKWEDGGNGYFVMFNSLIDDQITLYNEAENRQPDTCILESSFNLNNIHSPDDAVVTQAYLVWMGAVAPVNFVTPTDNAVHLKFVRADGNYTYEEDIIAGDEPKVLGDTADPFMFQSVQFNTEVSTGCSETEPGMATTADVAYFTYRADVSAFFKKIFDDNRASTSVLDDGEALYGTYTFSGLDCTEDDAYRCNGMMVSNWSIFFVYKSENVRSKRIYLYPGFAFLKGETMTAQISGFDLPKNPVVQLTSLVAGGEESMLFDQASPLEQMYIKGEGATSAYQLINDCNPYVEGRGYEVYNSNSSIVTWDPGAWTTTSCVTGIAGDPDFFGIDVDTFLLDSEDDINLQEHLKKDMASLDVTFSVNRDAILLNYLVFARDTKPALPPYDIPPEATNWPNGREKHFCSCATEAGGEIWCAERPMYYLIKVQNWGYDLVAPLKDIVVIDDLDPRIDYVPGTTEMATQFDENGDGTDWTAIPDGPNGEFPLAGAGYKVADTLTECSYDTWTCADTRLLRFKVVPKELPNNEIIPNQAYIKEAASPDHYLTNGGPLKLNGTWYSSDCRNQADCPEPPKSECGGEGPDADTVADADGSIKDDPTTDTSTTDTDIVTPQDDGCGCSLVW